MDRILIILEAIFFIVAGLSFLNAGLPRIITIIGALCGLFAGVLLLIQVV